MDSDLASFEFARAYVQARRHQKEGAVRIPVVKDERGKLVAVGRPVEWPPGVAERVITKKYELFELETHDCYKILSMSATRLQTMAHDESPQKMPAVGVPLVRQRSSTVLQRMRSGICKDKGDCPYMEDETIEHDDLDSMMEEQPMYGMRSQSLFAVIDGHGGRGAAEYIKSNLVENLLTEETFMLDPAAALVSATQKTDRNFLKLCEATLSGHHKPETSGATLLVVMLRGNELLVSNLGDCRAVVSRQGKATALSVDQKPSDTSEQLRIVKDGGFVEYGCLNGELRVSRAIGDMNKLTGKKTIGLSSTPEVSCFTIGPGDEFVLLASDGLWDVMQTERAVEFARAELTEHGDPKLACENLVRDAILNKYTEDNVSVIIISFFSKEHLERIQKQQKDLMPKAGGAWKPRRRQGASVDVNKLLAELKVEEEQEKASEASPAEAATPPLPPKTAGAWKPRHMR